MSRANGQPATASGRIRCAIYTRKSTEENLDRDFNTLDAQREAAEAYIKSQHHEGWMCLPERYDDGGFTGGNMDRPALKRLMADIEDGKVDAVVVYKVDRLSRSLLDFARLLEVFEKHDIAFISVTQQINSASSMGRLMLNVLLSFAQFEREIISERTRDKIKAAKRRGKYSGGRPILGYDVERAVAGSRLIVNDAEAQRVREIFRLYTKHASLSKVAHELNKRGWRNKKWQTRKGSTTGGREFTKNSLFKLLTNVIYLGKIPCDGILYDGEHEAIVSPEDFEQVQQLLNHNSRTCGKEVRNKHDALLRGLLRCPACECAMTHTFSTRRNRLYRYYTCTGAQKRGVATCPTRSVPAGELEQAVLTEVRAYLADGALVRSTLKEARRRRTARISDLKKDLKGIERELRSLRARIVNANGEMPVLMDDLREREVRRDEIKREIDRLSTREVTIDEVRETLADFDGLWSTLTTRERCRLLALLIERITYDRENEKLRIAFRPSGIEDMITERAA